MEQVRTRIYAFIIISFLLGSCMAATAGPKTWIDSPIDNSTLPLSPIFIMAHASDSDGIAKIEFYVDGQFINSAVPQPGAGERFGQAETQFTPGGLGTYKIEVYAVDSVGSKGAPTYATVTITNEAGVDDECPPDCPIQPEEAPPDESPPVDPSESVSASSEDDSTDTESIETVPTAVAKTNANCREGPGTDYVIYGSLQKGQDAEIKGRLSDNSWLLIDLADLSVNCWISSSTVDVKGDLGKVGVAAAPPPPVDDPPPADVIPPEPIDLTPPSFSTIAASPNTIWVTGCPGDTTTALVAVVTDESGISSVTAYWSIGGESGQMSLSEYALGWGATIGPFSTKGTMNIYFVAKDASDSKNSATSNNVSLTVKHCIQ